MTDLTISLKDRRKTKSVEIDGHLFKVRQIGAGEQMDLLSISRKMAELAEEQNNESLAKMEKYAKKFFAIYEGIFDDGVGGKKTRELIRSLSNDEIIYLINTIFKD